MKLIVIEMNLLVNNLISSLEWLIVYLQDTKKLFFSWLIAWAFISAVFLIAQTATPEFNKQAIKDQNFRIVRLEEKVDIISEAVVAIKFMDEKIDNVAGTQNFIILSVLGALSLNLFNTFKRKT